MKRIHNYINGVLTSQSKDFLPVYDPSKGEIISEVCLSNDKDFENVISSSQLHLINVSLHLLKDLELFQNIKN